MNPIFITARIIFSFLIPMFPLVGGAFAIYLDGTDWHHRYLIGTGPIGDYQLTDKGLDIFYLVFLLFVALKLSNKVIRSVLFGLFFYRLLGVVIFALTDTPSYLFFFPNIFENYFFFYYLVKTIAGYEPVMKRMIIVMTILLVSIPKVLDEYSMHLLSKVLVFDFFGTMITYNYIHEIIFIIAVSLLFGIYYRNKKRK